MDYAPFINYKDFKLPLQIDVLDVIYVMEGFKPVTRISLPAEHLDIFRQFCEANHLLYKLADFKIQHIEDKGKNGFSNSLKMVDPVQIDADFVIFITRNPDHIKTDFTALPDKEFGRLLGYPECCLEFYEKYKESAGQYQMDFVPFSVTEFKKYSFYTNYFLRYFNYTVISHFPCSCACNATIEIGRRNFQFFQKTMPEVADIMAENLKTAILYTETGGIYYFKEYLLENSILGKKLQFDNFEASQTDSEIYQLLSKNKFLDIISHDKVIIGNRLFYRDNLRIAIFE